jgi:hypothetical protein
MTAEPGGEGRGEAPGGEAARLRRAERVFCARLLNQEADWLERAGRREAALAVRRVVRVLECLGDARWSEEGAGPESP